MTVFGISLGSSFLFYSLVMFLYFVKRAISQESGNPVFLLADVSFATLNKPFDAVGLSFPIGQKQPAFAGRGEKVLEGPWHGGTLLTSLQSLAIIGARDPKWENCISSKSCRSGL